MQSAQSTNGNKSKHFLLSFRVGITNDLSETRIRVDHVFIDRASLESSKIDAAVEQYVDADDPGDHFARFIEKLLCE